MANSKQSGQQAAASAFTLTELLVVISIIAMLFALLMPVVSLVRESAQKAECLNNLHSLGMAMLQQAVDHRGRVTWPHEQTVDYAFTRKDGTHVAFSHTYDASNWIDSFRYLAYGFFTNTASNTA